MKKMFFVLASMFFMFACTQEAETTTTLISDDLGTLSFFYYDPIIRGKRNGLYDLYSVFNGTVAATLLPRDIHRY